MTPEETYKTIEANIWRQEQEHKQLTWQVWHIAALSRVKKMPPLSALIKAPPAKKLDEDEKRERQKEFEELTKKYGRNNNTR